MHVIVYQEALAQALALLRPTIDARPALPVLSCVMLYTHEGQLRLQSTNLELTLDIHIGAQVLQPGQALVPYRLFQEFVSTLPVGNVTLAFDKLACILQIQSGRTKTRVNTLSPDEFPPSPFEFVRENAWTIPGTTFQEAFTQVLYACASEDNRPILTGVHVKSDGQEMTFTAADGYQLALRRLLVELPAFEYVIPQKSLIALDKCIQGDAELTVQVNPERDNRIQVVGPHFRWSSLLLDGRFPDWRGILPRTYRSTVVMVTDDFIKAAKRAAIFARDNAYSVRFESDIARADTMADFHIRGKSKERGDADTVIDVQLNGEPVHFHANVQLLIESAYAVRAEQLVLAWNASNAPLQVQPHVESPLFTSIVMPMQRTE